MKKEYVKPEIRYIHGFEETRRGGFFFRLRSGYKDKGIQDDPKNTVGYFDTTAMERVFNILTKAEKEPPERAYQEGLKDETGKIYPFYVAVYVREHADMYEIGDVLSFLSACRALGADEINCGEHFLYTMTPRGEARLETDTYERTDETYRVKASGMLRIKPRLLEEEDV